MSSQIMMNQVKDYVLTNYPTKLLLGSAGLCAAATTEMALRCLNDVAQILQSSGEKRNNHAHDFSKNFFGAILFGMFASNAIPGIAIVGALIFTGNALLGSNDDALYTTQAIRCIKPIITEVVTFALDRIGDFFSLVNKILTPFVSFCGTILGAVIPKSPEAFGAVTLAIAIVAYKVLL